jgi:hypothetical protein
MTVLSHAPAGLLAGTGAAAALLALLSGLCAWHWLRRVLDVPRIPRPRAMYYALALAWGGLAAASAATTMGILLLRDHQRVAGRTELGEVRCEPTAAGHVRAEIKTAAAPEQYDVSGDACTISIKEIELRPGLRALGLGSLARVDAVGTLTRPTANPGWLTPAETPGPGLLGLVVRRTHAVRFVVPADPNRRFVLVAAPGQDPALQPMSI